MEVPPEFGRYIFYAAFLAVVHGSAVINFGAFSLSMPAFKASGSPNSPLRSVKMVSIGADPGLQTVKYSLYSAFGTAVEFCM